MSIVINSNGKLTSGKTEKKYLAIIALGHIEEREIISMRSAMAHRRVNATAIIDALKAKGELTLSSPQQVKGIEWLNNQWKTPMGKERKNNPFSYKQESILRNYSHFTLVGLTNVSNHDRFPYYLPIYRCYDVFGNYFDYAASQGKFLFM